MAIPSNRPPGKIQSRCCLFLSPRRLFALFTGVFLASVALSNRWNESFKHSLSRSASSASVSASSAVLLLNKEEIPLDNSRHVTNDLILATRGHFLRRQGWKVPDKTTRSTATKEEEEEEEEVATILDPHSPFPNKTVDKSKEQQEPHQNQAPDDSDYFSACLLVMDENPRLPEWLAYHYYMMPLRHVVLLVDPRSETSPLDIVERWRPHLQIDVWTDQDFEFDPGNRDDPNGLLHAHRQRQIKFYQACGLYLREQKRTWVSFHDVDEYVVLDSDVVPNATIRMSRPGSVLQLMNDLKLRATMKKRDAVTPATSGFSPKVVKYASRVFSGQCIVCPRTYFGATEETQERIQAKVPSYLNGSDFETLQWLHRTSHRDFLNNGVGKSFVHVTQGEGEPPFSMSSHRVLKNCPVSPGPRNIAPIRIRHYLGSWEAYASRTKDARIGDLRHAEMYEYRSQLGRNDPSDDLVRSWLEGFCSQMNHDQALIQNLLQGAGKWPSAPPGGPRWHLTPVQMQDEMDRMLVKWQNSSFPNFAWWLNNTFEVVALANGTLAATRRNVSASL